MTIDAPLTDPQWRSLVVRYMAHVLSEEGTTFTAFLPRYFSEDEKALLQALAEDAEHA